MLAPPITVGLSSLALPLYLTRLAVVDAFEFVALIPATTFGAVRLLRLADVYDVGLRLGDWATLAKGDVRRHRWLGGCPGSPHIPRELFKVFHFTLLGIRPS